MMLRRRLAALALAFGLCLPLAFMLAPAVHASEESPAPQWPSDTSDLVVDPGYVFGQLDNGMRYVVRQNATPQGTAMVRLRIASGSLIEEEHERGLAHFLEHMAFNGSNRIPEGEMVKLLEREGLAFGADTNASTGFEAITYMLNLPRNDPALLDTALMLMREVASELTISEDSVNRERGVILAEKRDRGGFVQRALEANIALLAPGARYGERMPIGTTQAIESASAADLRDLYQRTYVPANSAIIIVGDFPQDLLAAKIGEAFADWRGPDAPAPPPPGPINTDRRGDTAIYLDPALPENVTLTQLAPWQERPDTIAQRDAQTLRRIGYGIVNRRLARLARGEDAPFRSASFGTNDLFREARLTSLSISTGDGGWETGMLAAIREVNEALTHGFSLAEVEEQRANLKSALENAAKAAETRSHSAYVSAALRMLVDDRVPTDPAYDLELFERLVPAITPQAVWQAMLDDVSRFDDPLIRLQGRIAPAGGTDALRSAFARAMDLPIKAPADQPAQPFAYRDFGPPGTVASDEVDPRFGFRLLRFANGVRLTLKQTAIREDRIGVRLAIDGGNLLNTRSNPLATSMVSALAAGGLARHSRDELSSVLAGRSVGFGLTSGADAFTFSSTTTPRDLELQLQLITALVTDPGNRREGEEQFRRNIENFFAARDATPARALGSASGSILSDGDPRFSLQPESAFASLNFEKLMDAIGDRLERGAIEIAIAGDFDEDQAIAAVAKTLGALPLREAEFAPHSEARQRSFTAKRGTHLVEHRGEADQALVQMIWPTTDDTDHSQTLRLLVLGRVAQIALTEKLREDLGQTYSPSASSSASRVYPGYGTFTLSTSAAPGTIEVMRGAIADMMADLTSRPIDADMLERAVRPLMESYGNALKDLGGWLALAGRAQSDPARLARWQAAPGLISAITPHDLLQTAQAFLAPDAAVEIVVLPASGAQAVDLQHD